MNNGIWCADHKFTWIDPDHFELDRTESAANKEQVASAHWTVGLKEVWLQVRLEKIACDTFDCVVHGENVDTLTVWHITAGMDRDDVAKTNTQVLTHDLVQPDFLVVKVLVCQHDTHSVLALLTLQKDVVAAEEIELLHLRLGQGDHRIVIVECFLDDESVW